MELLSSFSFSSSIVQQEYIMAVSKVSSKELKQESFLISAVKDGDVDEVKYLPMQGSSSIPVGGEDILLLAT